MADSLTLNTVLPTRPEPIWSVGPTAPPAEVKRMAEALSIPPILAGVLWSRGLRTGAEAALNPPLELSPLANLDAAAASLQRAIEGGKRIVVHGDYDADGISGTAVLTLGLRALGAKVSPFIPHRLTDGYGISPKRVEEHAARTDLFMTVDCGISNLAEIAYLQAAGLEVIVTDHHHPGQNLPDCLTVHPGLSPSAQQGLPQLTGAGVAFHLLWALHKRLGLESPLEYSDLAAIGTIADVAPLMGENRALIQVGLEHLASSRWPGLRATVARSLRSGKPSARDVAFILAPRLNAAGRLGEAELGLELLTTASERRAKELAAYLDARNTDRRNIQDEMFDQALPRVEADTPAIVLDDPSWHPGVMGIVASKLLERFYKPVFIIAQGKGSVRSTPGISAVEGLHHAGSHLERFGGHSQAAGFAIAETNIAAFRDSIYEYVSSFEPPRPVIHADVLIGPHDIDRGLYEAIQALEPYGEGHPAPRFTLTEAISSVRAVGNGDKHLQLRLAGAKGVAWGIGDKAGQLPAGSLVNVALQLQENEWRGKRSIEFVAEDLRLAEPIGFEDASRSAPQIARGRPDPGLDVVTFLPDHPWPEAEELERAAAVHLRDLPLLEAEPLSLTSVLMRIVRMAPPLYFDLSDAVLERLSLTALQYPGKHDLRRAFVAKQRGRVIPFEPKKRELCLRILNELELLDGRGRAVSGQRRNPYRSETLLQGLMERYKLSTFVNAYRQLDDASFAHTVDTLFGKLAESGGGEAADDG